MTTGGRQLRPKAMSVKVLLAPNRRVLTGQNKSLHKRLYSWHGGSQAILSTGFRSVCSLYKEKVVHLQYTLTYNTGSGRSCGTTLNRRQITTSTVASGKELHWPDLEALVSIRITSSKDKLDLQAVDNRDSLSDHDRAVLTFFAHRCLVSPQGALLLGDGGSGIENALLRRLRLSIFCLASDLS